MMTDHTNSSIHKSSCDTSLQKASDPEVSCLDPSCKDAQQLPKPERIVARVARNSAVVFAAKAIEISSSLVVLMILARILQPERYGDFAWINAIVLSFQPLINLEINTILIREMSIHPNRENALLGGGMLLKAILVFAFVVCAVTLDYVVGFDPIMRTAFYLAVLAEVFQQIVWVYSAVFMARERMEFEPFLSLISRVASVSGIILVAIFWPTETIETNGFVAIFFILAFSQLLRAVIGMLIASNFMKSYRIQWSLNVAKELIRQSWIMGIATFFTGLSLRIDIYFLRYFRSSEEIALFHVPHMFTLQIQILAVSVVTALFPVFSRWGNHHADADRFRTTQDLSIRMMTLSGLIIAVFTALFPNLIIQILAGDAYLNAVPSMVILSICIPILFLNYLGTNLLIVIKKQNLLIYGAVVSLSLNCILDYMWVPEYGIQGAAIATVLSYGIQLIMVLIFLKKFGKHPINAVSAIGFPTLIFMAGFSLTWWFEKSLNVHTITSGISRVGIIVASIIICVLIQPTAFKNKILSR